MSLFLSEAERSAILTDPRLVDYRWALQRRVDRRAASPGLLVGDETADWWRPVTEYLTDAAMVHAIKPDPTIAAWLRDVTLSLVRRPECDWVGPAYRNHTPLEDGSHIGHLETAHLCWAIAAVLDLAPQTLTEDERDEVQQVLRDRGVRLCLNWLNRRHPVANWWCVMASGATVAAAVLDDGPMLQRTTEELRGSSEVFQNDGSYAESLQYGNYAIYALMLAGEALRRRGDTNDAGVPLDRYIGYARWAAASYLYRRPTTGWGPGARPRSLNFNDSGAVFCPTPEVLLHLAFRGAQGHPTEAGLARWLFEQTVSDDLDQGPFDQASFGLRTQWGFLTPPLLSNVVACGMEPTSPEDAGLHTTLAFDCGDLIARDGWGGRTVVAMRSAGQPMQGPGHLHRDLNSIILVHNDQRLLVDAGHSCYRNLLRQLELSTEMHNTCTFHVPTADSASGREIYLQQTLPEVRTKHGADLDPPVERPGRRLVAGEMDDVRVVGADASASYGNPLQRFARFVILCGGHAMFVVDHIISAEPVRTQWNWLLNNRDDRLDLKPIGDDRVVARRGDAGMKLICLADAIPSTRWAHVNDAYHCMPGQMGEGRPGSGVLLRWRERTPMTERLAIHAVVVDSYGAVARWHLRQRDGASVWDGAGGTPSWSLEAATDRLVITESNSRRAYEAIPDPSDTWSLRRLPDPNR